MLAKDLPHPPFFPKFANPQDYSAVAFGDNLGYVKSDVIYAIVPGYRPLTLDFYYPNDATGDVPVVLYIHGGAWLFGTNKLVDWQSHNKKIVEEILKAGMAVASMDYRHAAEERFPACVQDASAAVRWLRKFSAELGINKDAIGVWGESAGGHMAAMISMNSSNPEITGTYGVTDASSKVAAGVLWYAPINFASIAVQRFGDQTTEAHYRDNPEAFLLGVNIDSGDPIVELASPVNHVSSDSAPVLLLHGDADAVVPPAQSVEMAEKLAEHGREYVLELVPGADHVFEGVPIENQIIRSVEFLKEKLSS